MKDENGKELTEKEIIEEAINQLLDVSALLFEIESDEGKAMVFAVQTAILYCRAVCFERDPRFVIESNSF